MRVDDATQEKAVAAGEQRGQLVAGEQRGQLAAGQQRGKQQKAVGVEERTGAVNTRHRSREARQLGIGSSESGSR